jgi:hypothetical protein
MEVRKNGERHFRFQLTCGADFTLRRKTNHGIIQKIEMKTKTAPRTSLLELTEVGTEVPAHVERLEAHAAPPMVSGQKAEAENFC